MLFLLEKQHTLRMSMNQKILNLRDEKQKIMKYMDGEIDQINQIRKVLGIRKVLEKPKVHEQEFPKENRETFTDYVIIIFDCTTVIIAQIPKAEGITKYQNSLQQKFLIFCIS